MAGQRFRGGSKGRRDRRFGIADELFWDWWHRIGKRSNGFRDLRTVAEARLMYQEWVALGRPKAE